MEADPNKNTPATRRNGGSPEVAEQLRINKSLIRNLWEVRVREKIPEASLQTSLVLQNSMAIFLDDLANCLEQSSQRLQYHISERGLSKIHGEQRAHLAGYFLPQLFKEFSILREVIFEVLHETSPWTFEVSTVVNGAIDAAVSLAATEFASVQQQEVKAALEKAEASNRDLDHFAAVAAHDLKSPLATISGFLNLMSEDYRERLDPELHEYIDVMLKASERMQNLIDSLLEYARLANSDRQFVSVDLNEVIKSVLQNLHESIRRTHARISFGTLPSVRGDINLLIQLFQNLISNSIKFHGPAAPDIQIEYKIQNGEFIFTLKDNGIGFDPKDRESIFAIYKKLEGEQEHQGAGIGLATCRKVVELHGGRIWADSVPGKGSEFYFTLPIPAL